MTNEQQFAIGVQSGREAFIKGYTAWLREVYS